MNQTKHTGGQWRAAGVVEYNGAGAPGRLIGWSIKSPESREEIARVFVRRGDSMIEDWHNAQLIECAADMYEALQVIAVRLQIEADERAARGERPVFAIKAVLEPVELILRRVEVAAGGEEMEAEHGKA